MSFLLYKDNIKNMLDVLKQESLNNIMYMYAYHALTYIHAHAEDFEQEISVESPFYAEFFQFLRQEDLDENACFAFVECLIVFCRERQLHAHFQHDHAISSLLHFYEHSDLWAAADNTLLHAWYWYELPRRYSPNKISLRGEEENLLLAE